MLLGSNTGIVGQKSTQPVGHVLADDGEVTSAQLEDIRAIRLVQASSNAWRIPEASRNFHYVTTHCS